MLNNYAELVDRLVIFLIYIYKSQTSVLIYLIDILKYILKKSVVSHLNDASVHINVLLQAYLMLPIGTLSRYHISSLGFGTEI